MADTSEEHNVNSQMNQETPMDGKILAIPPASTDGLISGTIRLDDSVYSVEERGMHHGQAKGEVHMSTNSPVPGLSDSPPVQKPTLEIVPRTHGEEVHAENKAGELAPGGKIYQTPPNTESADFAPMAATGIAEVRTGDSIGTGNEHVSPASVPSDSRSSSWKDFSTQTVIGPGFPPSSTRPTSVPNFQTRHISKRREGPEYPTYPDQSFKALQNQQHPPLYHSRSPHRLRTQSSHSSQNLPYASSDNKEHNAVPPSSSGAKTVGNTPAQSPGLFTPPLDSKKGYMDDSEDGRSSTPMLHPTQHKEPRE